MDRRIESLTPATQELARKLIAACDAAGVPIKITSTLRTAAEQDALYAQGRTAPGQIVTKLKGGQGIHETGQAFDIIPVNGGYHASAETWQKIGSIGEGLGLEWGGNWKSFKDLPHFQLKGAKSGRPYTPTNQPPAANPAPGNPTPAPSEATTADKSSNIKSAYGNSYIVNNAPPIPNRLHQYASYIYSLSLHMLTNEEYSNIVVTQSYTPKNVIIASAGRHSANFVRNKNWSEDFYFEQFDLKTVIVPNDQSRNTNAIQCEFQIIEPYGFTMIERILKTTEELGGKNYLDMPYLVQIDFFGLDDAGEILGSIPDLQKRFPIKLTKLDVKLTERGAEYKLAGVPFQHAAFTGIAVTVPAHMEVTARTVKDFFQSVEGTAADSLAQEVASKTDLQQRQTQDAAAAKQNYAPTLMYSSLSQNSTINVDSLGTAINAYYKGLKDNNKADVADIFRFEFLPDPDTGEDVIGSATFVEDKRNTPKETPMKKNTELKDAISMRLSDIGNSQNTYDTSRGIFSINYGTTILSVLEYVIRNSTYIHDQLILPDGVTSEEYKARKEAMKDKPLKWFRIIPKVRLLGFDTKRNLWAKEYTYVVKPYKMYNLRSDLAPQGIVVTPVKNYNYIFTGKNVDILDLDIQFNTSYFNMQTANRSALAKTSPTGDQLAVETEYQNAPNYTGGDPPKGINPESVMPSIFKPVTQDSRNVSAGNPADAKAVGAADLAQSIMSSGSADMIHIKLNIIGDPDYIKQDDIFYGPDTSTAITVSSEIDQRLLPDGGSLRMDDGGVYVQVLFKVPRDIDDQTGFMKYEAGQRNSVFSGLYMVVTVNSTFTKGQFTQSLELVRLPRQVAFDYVGNTDNNKSSERPGSEELKMIPVKQADNTTPTSNAEKTDTAVDQTAGQDQKVAQDNAAETPTQTQEQKDLAAIRASGVTAAINDQNKPQEVPTVKTPTEAEINTQFKGEATVIAKQVGDLVNQRNGVVSQRNIVYNSYNRLADQLIAADPKLGDLSDNELQSKNADLANLWAQYKNLSQQQKDLNAEITTTADKIPAAGFAEGATIQASIDFNASSVGPNPIITVGGTVLYRA